MEEVRNAECFLVDSDHSSNANEAHSFFAFAGDHGKSHLSYCFQDCFEAAVPRQTYVPGKFKGCSATAADIDQRKAIFSLGAEVSGISVRGPEPNNRAPVVTSSLHVQRRDTRVKIAQHIFEQLNESSPVFFGDGSDLGHLYNLVQLRGLGCGKKYTPPRSGLGVPRPLAGS